MATFPEHNQNQLLLSAVEQAFNAVLITLAKDSKGNHPIIYANAAFCELTGYGAEELLGKDPRILQGPDTSKKVIDRLRRSLKDSRFFHGSTVNYKKDGTPYYVEWSISPIFGDTGKVEYYLSIQQDLTKRIASDERNQLLTSAFNVTDDAVFITNSKAQIEFVNEAFVRLSGYSRAELLGNTPSLLKSGEHDQNFYNKLWTTILSGETFRATFINKNKSGVKYHQEQTITPIKDSHSGYVTHFVSISKDITKRVKEEIAFREEAKKDSLTGTLVRKQGERELERLFSDNAEIEMLSLAIVDIDHFKTVNDTWGHQVGDEVIQLVAKAMLSSVRGSDSVVRWGGEEFVIIMHQCSLDDALLLMTRCVQKISEDVHPRVGKVTVSAGLAQIKAGEDAQALINRADEALYRAKEAGRDRIFKSE